MDINIKLAVSMETWELTASCHNTDLPPDFDRLEAGDELREVLYTTLGNKFPEAVVTILIAGGDNDSIVVTDAMGERLTGLELDIQGWILALSEPIVKGECASLLEYLR